MSDYTPTTGEVRRRYAYARSGKPGHKNQGAVAEFDRWLAAHDAEKRAEWEAEQSETEWEYLVSHAWDGRQVITTIPQRFSPEQWVVERRQVIFKKILTEWLPVPDTTNNESEGKA